MAAAPIQTAFEARVREVVRQVYGAVGGRSAEAETRSAYGSVLLAELDTQVQELLGASQALAASRRNCAFDLGFNGKEYLEKAKEQSR
ncbi:hypothetical protein GGI07_002960 [Coemansia sp. Benny D115]|nr:hypothetical protein GGI07_002960 [Coemansia sp. Benny D115]